MARWDPISESEYPWEREALAFIQKRLPPSSPLQAWSNFEFRSETGAIYEVDLLVIGPWGAFLIEIKSIPGTVSSQGGTWTWRHGTDYKTRDNPLPLANRKCKALKSLLGRRGAFRRSGKTKAPWIEPLVFCSDDSNVLDLHGPDSIGVCVRDKEDRSVPGIVGAISRREATGLKTYRRPPISTDQIRAFSTAVEDVSLQPVKKTRKAGDYLLNELLYDSPRQTYQEWLGQHVRTKSGPRLIRVYMEGLQGDKERAILRRAAEREFQILERLDHPGIQRVDTLTETELGPALVFRWQEGSQRLDHFLAEREHALSADVSLEILRQVTEAIAYAHRKQVIHRGLSPQSLIVLSGAKDAPDDVPQIQIGSWHLGFVDASTTGHFTKGGSRPHSTPINSPRKRPHSFLRRRQYRGKTSRERNWTPSLSARSPTTFSAANCLRIPFSIWTRNSAKRSISTSARCRTASCPRWPI